MKAKYSLLTPAILCAITQIPVACNSCFEQKAADEITNACPCQKPPTETKVSSEISVGELADKITILELKMKYITDEEKLKNIETELTILLKIYKENVEQTPELRALKKQLLAINQQLWDIENTIRDKERRKEFDDEFKEIARSVYITNDKRCVIKRAINELTGSRLIEEKSYVDYIDTN